MDAHYESAYAQNAAFWSEGSIDKRYKVGDQSLNVAYQGGSQTKDSSRFFFNRIARQVNMIVGRQRQNRKSTITMPRFDNDICSDDYNKVLKWSENFDGFQEYFSQAFEGACDTGISLLHLYPDFSKDPMSGDLYTDNVSYNNFLIDPFFKKQDLSDCRFIWRRKWVNKIGAKSLLPGMKSEIDKMRPSGKGDGKFPLQAELLNLDRGLFTYDEYYYDSTRKAVILLDPKTQESVEWDGNRFDDDDELKNILAEQPWLIKHEYDKQTVKLCIALDGKIVYNGENLLSIDSYPFVPVLGYHEPDLQSYKWRIRGVVRNLRDAQYLYNLRKGIELSILQSQVNSGWMFKPSAVTDMACFRQTGEGVLIPLKESAQQGDIERIPPPDLPQGLMELSASLADEMPVISGVNEELLGSATDDKSGILSMLRQGAGLTTLQTLFDKADYSQRLYGKIRLEAITKNFSRGKITSILGKEPDPAFFSAGSLRYSIAVEEGNYSATQRQTELQQLLHFKEIGLQIPDTSILRAATLTNKPKLLQEMTEQMQQQAQQEQAQAQQEAESSDKELNTRMMAAFSKSKLDMAREKESLAKVGEIEATAEHKETAATLDLVKSMIELEDMDFAQYERALAMAQNIKQQNQQDQQLGDNI